MAVIAALSLFAAVPAAAQAKKIITISGSTSVFPLETQLARAWIKTKKGKKYGFRILQGGSNVGISDVAKGRVSIGASSRDPAAGDPGGLVFTKIARDAICMITNNSNPLGNITSATIKNIFVGPTFTNWSQVPGAPISGSIDPIGRAPTSGTHDAFRNIFLGGTNQGSFVAAKASNGLVQQGVQSDPQGIGYVSLAFTNGVHTVNYNGVECTLRNAASFQYGGVRSFYFVTRGAPVGGVKKFIGWTLASPRANSIVGTDWVPLH
jgi:phosphate transport system substrate-binding protein